jgi:hypothetical protein
MDAFHRKYWAEPDYVSEGETVALPVGQDFDTGLTRVVRCKVLVAAGNHARIANEEKGIDRWVSLASLLVAPEDPRHPNQRRAREAAIFQALMGEGAGGG